MVFPHRVAAFLAPAFCGVSVLSHPGDSIGLVNHEAALHKAALRTAHASMAECENHPEALRLKENVISHRTAYAETARRNNSPLVEKVMDALKKWEAISHDHIGIDWDDSTPESVIFGSNATTALSPESILGPYFVSGELFRTDINKQQYLTNQEDGFAKDAASSLYDPFMSYVRLGRGPADGILAYITVGIDQGADYDASPAARWGSDGGHECHNVQCN